MAVIWAGGLSAAETLAIASADLSAPTCLAVALSLLPPGIAFPRDEDTELARLVDGLTRCWDRVQRRADSLGRQFTPATADVMLADWARVLGAEPESSAPVAARQREVSARLADNSSLTLPRLTELVEAYGWALEEVREHRPFRVGHSRVGDALSNDGWVFVGDLYLAWQGEPEDAGASFLRLKAHLERVCQSHLLLRLMTY